MILLETVTKIFRNKYSLFCYLFFCTVFYYSQKITSNTIYLHAGPLFPFARIVESDPSGYARISGFPTISYGLGYNLTFKNHYTLDVTLSIKKYKIISYSLTPPYYTSKNKAIKPTITIALGKLIILSNKLSWKNAINVGMCVQKDIQFIGGATDTSANIYNQTVSNWGNGVMPFLGLNSGIVMHKKRNWYVGVGYSYGIRKFVTVQSTYDNDGLAGSVKAISHLSHLQLDFLFYFNSNKSTNHTNREHK